MNELGSYVKNEQRIAVGGHIRPDGDCIGSTTACVRYLQARFPEKEIVLFVEEPAPEIHYLTEGISVYHDADASKELGIFDVFICMDCEKDRLGFAEVFFDQAKITINIDHHVTNRGMADIVILNEQASSTAEVLFEHLDLTLLDASIAESIFVAIVHDTGVFQYSNTSPRTMEIAGKLISFGFDFSTIIEETFYKRTYLQTQVMAKVLLASKQYLDGSMIVGWISKQEMDELGITSNDTSGIVNQLRNVENTKCAAFLYEKEVDEWKVSLRTTDQVDASAICFAHGGGGHKKAAGCNIKGSVEEVISILVHDVHENMQEI